MAVETIKHTRCYHCGEDVGLKPILHDEKVFCCNGCSSVYSLLKDHQLYKYYELSPSPGLKEETEENIDSRFSFLDNEAIEKELLDFKTENLAKVTFVIPSIHCSSCIWLLENLQKLNSGIIGSTVNFIKKEILITYNPTLTTLRKIAELLESIHYTPVIALQNVVGRKAKKQSNKQLIYKLGVAGFCFGNIMLLSFPEYFSFNDKVQDTIVHFFRIFNLVLALPVFFYSASEFFSSAFKSLRKGAINVDLPIVIGIIALFARSVYEILFGMGSGYFDSLAGLVFFLLIGRWYQNKTYESLSFERDYKSYFPVAVERINDSGSEQVMIDTLSVGDVIRVKNNELIPSDSILLKGQANIDYSFVTGESIPSVIKEGGRIFAGGRQRGEALLLKVEKQVSQSYLTQLWNEEHSVDKDQSLQLILDSVGRYFTLGVIAVAFSALLVWLFLDPSKAVFVFTSVLIVACPCALALSAPFGLGTAIRMLGRHQFYIRSTSVIEHLANVKHLVFDKTGTLTHNNRFNVVWNGKAVTKVDLKVISTVVYQSLHPLSVAISKFLGGNSGSGIIDFEEVAGKGLRATLDGQMKVVMGSSKWLEENEIRLESSDSLFVDSNETGSVVHVALNGLYLGCFILTAVYRDGLENTLKQLGDNYHLHLLSGDNNNDEYRLRASFSNWESLKFNQSPVDKLNFITGLQLSDCETAMLGDGLNDAGALRQSNVGIAVAHNLASFVPASDIIMKDNRLPLIPGLLKFSKKSMNVIRISIVLSVLYNLIGVTFAITGQLTPILSAILMPLSSVTIVAFVSLSTLWLGKRVLTD